MKALTRTMIIEQKIMIINRYDKKRYEKECEKQLSKKRVNDEKNRR